MAIFDTPISNMVPIADTATDADSPNSALLADKYRVWLEMLLQSMFGLFGTGTLTSDPPNDTTGYAYDTGAGFVTDEHNGRRIIFTDGMALGQDFLIDDTVAGSRVVCTDDNLYAAGARSGDGYIIIGNFRNSLGHIHDSINGRNFIPYRSVVGSDGSDFTTASASLATVCHQRIYISDDSQTLIYSARLYASGGYDLVSIIKIGGDSGTPTLTHTGATPTWKDGCEIDISGYAPGYYDVEIQLSVSAGGTGHVEGFAIFIE